MEPDGWRVTSASPRTAGRAGRQVTCCCPSAGRGGETHMSPGDWGLLRGCGTALLIYKNPLKARPDVNDETGPCLFQNKCLPVSFSDTERLCVFGERMCMRPRGGRRNTTGSPSPGSRLWPPDRRTLGQLPAVALGPTPVITMCHLAATVLLPHSDAAS